MSSIIRGLIEGVGIKDIKTYPGNIKYFTEVTCPEIYKIPENMPFIKSIISMAAEPVLVSKKIIRTPASKSIEGQRLLGANIIVEIKLKQIIKYEPIMPDMGIRIINIENMIHGISVAIPKNIDGTSTEELCKQNKIIVMPYVEDVFVDLFDKRTIYKNVILFTNVEIAV